MTLIAYDELDSENENLNFWNTVIKRCVLWISSNDLLKWLVIVDKDNYDTCIKMVNHNIKL
jgi:hypothetical protein